MCPFILSSPTDFSLKTRLQMESQRDYGKKVLKSSVQKAAFKVWKKVNGIQKE